MISGYTSEEQYEQFIFQRDKQETSARGWREGLEKGFQECDRILFRRSIQMVYMYVRFAIPLWMTGSFAQDAMAKEL